MIQEKQNYEKFLRELYEDVLNQKNFAVLDKFFSRDIIIHDGRRMLKGLEEAKRTIKERSDAIPDFYCQLEDILIEGNKAVVRWRSTGNPVKDFVDFRTGKEFHYRGMTLFEKSDNLIVRLWEYATLMDV